MRKSWRTAAGLILSLGAALYLYYTGNLRLAPRGQPRLTALTSESVGEFQAEFNRSADRVRLVLLISPT